MAINKIGKVVITGASGLVGSRVIELLTDKIDIIPLDHQIADITDKNSLFNFFKNIDYDILVHFAAYTNVDKAEEEREKCYQINVEGTKNLFEIAADKNKKFVYISTDFVFDGKTPPFWEDSKPNPLSWYGKTKYQGEKIVRDKGMIIRIASPYGISPAKKQCFVRRIINLLNKGVVLKMIDDSLITPTFIDDIAAGLFYLLQNYTADVFHLTGKDSLSPYEIGKNIAKTFGFSSNLIKKTSFKKFFRHKAVRPQWSVIKSKKNSFCPMKNFQQGLKELASTFPKKAAGTC